MKWPLGIGLIVLIAGMHACYSPKISNTELKQTKESRNKLSHSRQLVNNGLVRDSFDGKIIAKGTYNDALKEGTWIYYDEDEKPKTEANYSSGRFHGSFKVYKKGKLINERNYQNGKLQDTFKVYYLSGQLAKLAYYQEDKKHGLESYYYLSGKKLKTLNYRNDTLHGDLYSFYENGEIASKETYTKGELNGLQIHYFGNQQMINLRQYTNGKIDSVFKQYLANGFPDNSYQLMGGTGLVKTYFENGNIKSIESYKNGIKSGVQKYYYSNGNTRNIENYLEGKIQGLSKNYSKTGELILEGMVENGMKSGIWKILLNGELSEKEFNIDDKTKYKIPEDSNYFEQFKVANEMPSPHGGMNGFRKYLASTIKYPQTERELGIEGKVFVQFIIGITGEIENVELIPGTEQRNTEAMNKIALDVIKNSPYWNPGLETNEAIRVKHIMPIEFRLTK